MRIVDYSQNWIAEIFELDLGATGAGSLSDEDSDLPVFNEGYHSDAQSARSHKSTQRNAKDKIEAM